MNVQEMHLAFKIGYDKIDSLNYPDILPLEIDFLLNKAQDRFVKQRYGTTNIKRQSFEETQKRTDDIKALVKNAVLVPLANTANNIDPNAQFVTLPSDYWFTVQERVGITYLNCNNVTTNDRGIVEVVQHDDFNNIIKSPFDKPNNSKVLRLMSYNTTELVHSPTTTITQYYLRYIKKPVRISIVTPTNCELSDHTHEEIVSDAIAIALENIEAIRTKTFDLTKNTEE